ncbi:MAG: hypothetical protein AAFW69_08110, partial [Pseudomonadota bacterium]
SARPRGFSSWSARCAGSGADPVEIIALVIVGAVAGLIATRAFDLRLPLWQTILLGIGGALVGWVLLGLIFVAAGLIIQIAAAVLGALILIALIGMVARR